MYRPMKVSGLILDEQTQSPVVILKDDDGKTTLPIWIGLLEATAIAAMLEKAAFPRPMTHDLFTACLARLDATLERVEVCDLRENTYYALVHLKTPGGAISLDARPSDAIALALRAGAPILVSEDVLRRSLPEGPPRAASSATEKEKWAEILEGLNPEDFTKYRQ